MCLNRVLRIGFIMVFTALSSLGCLYQHQSAKLSIELDIQHSEWASLVGLMSEFSEQNGLSFNDFSEEYPSGTKKMLLVMKSKKGVEVSVMGLYPETNGLAIAIYENKKDSGWMMTAEEIKKLLDGKWSYKVTAPEEKS